MAFGNSFGAIAFGQEQQAGTSVLVWPAEAVLAVEHIAGGDLDLIQNLGKRGTQEVSVAIVVLAADWAGLLALVGQSATLALIGNASRTATLTKLAGGRYHQAAGIYRATATWIG